jgi:hypothetical protein
MNIKHSILLAFFSFFAINGYSHVNLLNPEAGDTFKTDNQISVEWEIYIDHGPCTWELYYSPDGGNTWDTVATGIDKSTTSYLWTLPDKPTENARIRVVQNNKDFRNTEDESDDFTISQKTVSNVQESLNPVFNVRSIHPNPFRNFTRISFEMGKPSEVNISIYSIQGRKVRTLTQRMFSAGTHQIEWNASDMPVGIYLCRISSGSQVTTRRLVHRN